MKKLIAIAALSFAASASFAANNCVFESVGMAPELPNGSTASMEEMISAQANVAEFVKTEEQKLAKCTAKSAFDHNVSRLKIKNVAERFNTELRAFMLQQDGFSVASE